MLRVCVSLCAEPNAFRLDLTEEGKHSTTCLQIPHSRKLYAHINVLLLYNRTIQVFVTNT